MAGFDSLPEETILNILEFLPGNSTTGDRYNAILVSRQFYRLSLPLLYEDLINFGGNKNSRNISELCFILLLDPTKARFVQRFAIQGPRLRSDVKVRGYTDERQTQVQNIIKDICSRAEPYQATFVKRIWAMSLVNRAQLPALMFFAASRLPFLRELRIEGVDGTHWSDLRHITNGWTMLAIRNPPRLPGETPTEPRALNMFPCLETVRVDEPTFIYNPHSPLWTISRWPSVRHIHASRVGDFYYDPPRQEDLSLPIREDFTMNLTSLSLWPSSRVADDELIHFFGLAQGLEKFSYHIDCERQQPPVSTLALMYALQQQKQTLREINLKLHYDPAGVLKRHPNWRPMSFDGYYNLEQLSVSYELLLCSEDESMLTESVLADHVLKALPTSLKVLRIIQCHDEFEAAIARDAARIIFQSEPMRWTELEELSLSVINGADESGDHADWVASLAAERGVSYQTLGCGQSDELGFDIPDEPPGGEYGSGHTSLEDENSGEDSEEPDERWNEKIFDDEEDSDDED